MFISEKYMLTWLSFWKMLEPQLHWCWNASISHLRLLTRKILKGLSWIKQTASANLSDVDFPAFSAFEVREVVLILSRESGQVQKPQQLKHLRPLFKLISSSLPQHKKTRCAPSRGLTRFFNIVILILSPLKTAGTKYFSHKPEKNSF